MAEISEATVQKGGNKDWLSTVVVDSDNNFVGYLNIPAASVADPSDLSKLNKFIGSDTVEVKLPEVQERATRF